jgi:predicted nuclease of predicted toxin-antitoxin system
MGTLASELGPHAGRIAGQPRLYVDANMPSGLVTFMRTDLQWDVLFVMEHDDLRRARDGEHYRLARQLRRTLITLDRDYLDDRKFPPGESGGVLVLTAPEQKGLAVLLARLDKELFRRAEAVDAVLVDTTPLPLEGRKLHVHIDWTGDTTIRDL